MSDTAEYWSDVKSRYVGPYFTHFVNSPCGHIKPHTGNTHQSKYINDVRCYACLRLIKQNGNIYGLVEGISRSEQSAIDKKNYLHRNGTCKCGSHMVERINSKNGQIFLGCSSYPKCKLTKSKA